jgi:hypothetical protein
MRTKRLRLQQSRHNGKRAILLTYPVVSVCQGTASRGSSCVLMFPTATFTFCSALTPSAVPVDPCCPEPPLGPEDAIVWRHLRNIMGVYTESV